MMKKTFIITGCSSGLGYELTKKLLNSGQIVIPIIKTNSKNLEFCNYENCYPLIADISNDDFALVLENHLNNNKLNVDCIIFNASPNINNYTLDESFVKDMNLAFDTIVMGHYYTFIGAKKFLNKNPIIIAISSRLGSITMQHNGEFNYLIRPPSYKIAKAAFNMLIGILKQENPLIKFIVVHPGLMNTKMGSKNGISPSYIADKLLKEINTLSSNNFINLETGDIILW